MALRIFVAVCSLISLSFGLLAQPTALSKSVQEYVLVGASKVVRIHCAFSMVPERPPSKIRTP